jgi:hypothetical protein
VRVRDDRETRSGDDGERGAHRCGAGGGHRDDGVDAGKEPRRPARVGGRAVSRGETVRREVVGGPDDAPSTAAHPVGGGHEQAVGRIGRHLGAPRDRAVKRVFRPVQVEIAHVAQEDRGDRNDPGAVSEAGVAEDDAEVGVEQAPPAVGGEGDRGAAHSTASASDQAATESIS